MLWAPSGCYFKLATRRIANGMSLESLSPLFGHIVWRVSKLPIVLGSWRHPLESLSLRRVAVMKTSGYDSAICVQIIAGQIRKPDRHGWAMRPIEEA